MACDGDLAAEEELGLSLSAVKPPERSELGSNVLPLQFSKPLSAATWRQEWRQEHWVGRWWCHPGQGEELGVRWR